MPHKASILNSSFAIKYCFNLEKRLYLKILRTSSLVLAVFLLGFCIFQLIAMTSEFYLIASYEKRATELFQENKDLQIRLSQQGSLGDLEKMVEHSNFELVTKIHYIEILDGTVVTKQR